MNSIQKQKTALIAFGAVLGIVGVLLLVFGIILTVSGANNITEVGGIIKLVLGILMIVLFIPSLLLCVRLVWVGLALTATNGSIKMGNIAKEGGTVNMVKCDKCGTEIKDGETACSNCGKPFERK